MTYVKTAEYIDAEKAAKEFSEQLGEDFISVLGYNPLQSSIEVKLHAQYANLQYFNIIEKKLKKNPVVEEIIYEKSLIHLLNENIRKISIVILGFTAIFFLIAVWLINNNVRLMVYSRRFIIRTMQLVGATRGFIRRPFLVNSIFQGFIAGILANVMIIGIIYFTNQELKEINLMIDIKIMYVLISFIILLAIFINLVSTFFAVNKYLNISTDNLYAL